MRECPAVLKERGFVITIGAPASRADHCEACGGADVAKALDLLVSHMNLGESSEMVAMPDLVGGNEERALHLQVTLVSWVRVDPVANSARQVHEPPL